MPAVRSFTMSQKERCSITALVDVQEVRRLVPSPNRVLVDARDGGVEEEWERTSVATGDDVAAIGRGGGGLEEPLMCAAARWASHRSNRTVGHEPSSVGGAHRDDVSTDAI